MRCGYRVCVKNEMAFFIYWLMFNIRMALRRKYISY